jgi:hypothetical protein
MERLRHPAKSSAIKARFHFTPPARGEILMPKTPHPSDLAQDRLRSECQQQVSHTALKRRTPDNAWQGE